MQFLCQIHSLVRTHLVGPTLDSEENHFMRFCGRIWLKISCSIWVHHFIQVFVFKACEFCVHLHAFSLISNYMQLELQDFVVVRNSTRMVVAEIFLQKLKMFQSRGTEWKGETWCTFCVCNIVEVERVIAIDDCYAACWFNSTCAIDKLFFVGRINGCWTASYRRWTEGGGKTISILVHDDAST